MFEVAFKDCSQAFQDDVVRYVLSVVGDAGEKAVIVEASAELMQCAACRLDGDVASLNAFENPKALAACLKLGLSLAC